MNRLLKLVCVAPAEKQLPAAEFKRCASLARDLASQHDVVGVLVYDGECFAIIVEGTSSNTLHMLSLIERALNSGLKVLRGCSITQKTYTSWAVGYLHEQQDEGLIKALVTASSVQDDAIDTFLKRVEIAADCLA